MRPSIHIFFGKASSEALLELSRYVHLHSTGNIPDFFTALEYEEDETSILIREAICEKKDNLNSFFSTSDEDNWDVRLENRYQASKESFESTLKTYVRGLWRDRINTDYRGVEPLHFCFYVPFDAPEAWGHVASFLSAIESEVSSAEIDIVGLSYRLMSIIKGVSNIDEDRRVIVEKECLANLIKLTQKSSFVLHGIVLQDQTNEHAIPFTLQSLAAVLGEFASICIENYQGAFGSLQNSSELLSFGLSVLGFDEYYFKEYLLQAAFLKLLDKERVMDAKVDITWAAQEIDKMLKPWETHFADIFESEVQSRLNMGMEATGIAPELHAVLEKTFKSFNDDIQKQIVENPHLSLVKKKALLSALLGQDDELFEHGTLIHAEQMILSDLESLFVDFIIEENNALLEDEQTQNDVILPPYTLEDLPNTEPSRSAQNIRKKMKQIRYEERNLISEIRHLTDELEMLKANSDEIDASKKCLVQAGRVVFNQREYKLLPQIDETPLQDNYTPHEVKARSADLSGAFPNIKDQGKQGACLSFSLVSVFEYFLKTSEGVSSPDLSEQFLYYISRDKNGETEKDEGSCICFAVEALCETGICVETKWPYKVDGYAEKPTEDAYADAAERKVKKALNVERKTVAIKSALEDGYPVIGSFSIFSSFGKGERGFISIPTDEEIAAAKESNENNHHAMVIVGFNDEQKVFKVRNSWGSDWGDNGYCYIPYQYIEGEKTFHNASIITEIAIAQTKVVEENEVIQDNIFTIRKEPHPTLAFAETDILMKYALRANLLEEKKRTLYELQCRDSLLKSYEESLMIRARERQLRDRLVDRGTYRRNIRIDKLNDESKKLTKDENKEVSAYKRHTIIHGAIVCVSLLAITIVAWIISLKYKAVFSDEIIKWMVAKEWISSGGEYIINLHWISIVSAIVLILFCLIYFYLRIEKRKDIQNRFRKKRKAIHQEVEQLEDEIKSLPLHLTLSGEVLSDFFKFSSQMQTQHAALNHLIYNLREWKEKTAHDHAEMTPNLRVPFISILDNATLNTYFQNHSEQIVGGIHLSDFIRDYKPSDEGIIALQLEMKEGIIFHVDEAIKDFSLMKYILSIGKAGNYEFLTKQYTAISSLFEDMDRKSEAFVRFDPSHRVPVITRTVFVKTDSEGMMNTLSDKLKNSIQTFSVCPFDQKGKMVLFQCLYVPKDDILVS